MTPKATTIVQIAEVPRIDPGMDIAVARGLYLDSLESSSTKRAYARHTEGFCALMGLSTIGGIEAGHLVAFRNYLLMDGRGVASHSQALNAVKSFLVWAASMDGLRLRTEQVKGLLKVPKATVLKPYQTLAPKEIVRFLDTAKASGPRDYAIVLVFLGAGLRVSEVVGLSGKDLREDGDGNPFLHVRAGKGRKDRFVPVAQQVLDGIQSYYAASKRKLGSDAPLFLGESNRASASGMDTRTCGYLVKRLCEDAKIVKSISCHSLRHTYAIACLRHGKNLMAVSKLLGHSMLATTQRYVDHLELMEMREVVPGYLVGADSNSA